MRFILAAAQVCVGKHGVRLHFREADLDRYEGKVLPERRELELVVDRADLDKSLNSIVNRRARRRVQEPLQQPFGGGHGEPGRRSGFQSSVDGCAEGEASAGSMSETVVNSSS